MAMNLHRALCWVGLHAWFAVSPDRVRSGSRHDQCGVCGLVREYWRNVANGHVFYTYRSTL